MADYAKDSEKQTALRRQIENHPIWQYPPEERLQQKRWAIFLCRTGEGETGPMRKKLPDRLWQTPY